MKKFNLIYLVIIYLGFKIFVVVSIVNGVKQSSVSNERHRIYKENSEFYISGQVFKIEEVEKFLYALFVKVDSVNILKTNTLKGSISGIYDDKKGIAVLICGPRFRSSGIQNFGKVKYPYVICKSIPQEKIHHFEFSHDKLGLSNQIWDVEEKDPFGQYLLQQMDTMQNPIKF